MARFSQRTEAFDGMQQAQLFGTQGYRRCIEAVPRAG